MNLFPRPQLPDLDELAIRHQTDKSSLLNAFTEKYVPYLEPRRQDALTLLEIGVSTGGSLRMWRDYFPRGLILGIDVVDAALAIPNLPPGVRTHRVDQGDRAQLEAFATAVAGERGGFDLIVDDGSHLCAHQILAFKTLFPYLRPGGIYFVEDVTTSYREDPYGGGVGRPDSLLRFAQDLIPFIPMSMGGVPPREAWERDLDFVHVHGFGGLLAVGKLSADRRARFYPPLPVSR
ncbi:MAG TPA: class I SAM-dependent methyltransferase [Thermoanaerobaculia bacterium]|nr:class I SAM-dependent methyltransferase [Thermoanaerobaculia bacterium]